MSFRHDDLESYLQFLHKVADATEPLLQATFKKPLAVDDKGATKGEVFDPVTATDRDVETLIRALIMEAYPNHGILGEEHGTHQGDASWIWTLDPIDGTRAFITGIPVWGTLIALSHEGIPELGMMNQPYLKERYFGTKQGSFLQTPDGITPLKSRHYTDPLLAMGTCTTPDMFKTPSEKVAFNRIHSGTRHIRYGTDCYGYAMLAAGHVDFVCETSLAPYDVRALIPLVQGAGGIMTTWSGGDAAGGGQILASSNETLHNALLSLLKNPS